LDGISHVCIVFKQSRGTPVVISAKFIPNIIYLLEKNIWDFWNSHYTLWDLSGKWWIVKMMEKWRNRYRIHSFRGRSIKWWQCSHCPTPLTALRTKILRRWNVSLVEKRMFIGGQLQNYLTDFHKICINRFSPIRNTV